MKIQILTVLATAGCMSLVATATAHPALRSPVDADNAKERVGLAQTKPVSPGKILDEALSRMEAAHGLLTRTVTGDPTRKQQTDAIALLDQLINALMEQQKEPPEKPDEPKNDDPPPDIKPIIVKDPRPEPKDIVKIITRLNRPENPVDPAEESILPDDGTTGQPGEQRPSEGLDGQIPLRQIQFEKVVVEIRQKYPDRYRDVLEAYFRQLASTKR